MVAAGKVLGEHHQVFGRLRQNVQRFPPRTDVVGRLPLAHAVYVAVAPPLPLLDALRVYPPPFPKVGVERELLAYGQKRVPPFRRRVRVYEPQKRRHFPLNEPYQRVRVVQPCHQPKRHDR